MVVALAPLDERAQTRRFLLELWLEPRAADVAADTRRMRGRVRELGDDDQSPQRQRAVGNILDVDAFVRECFAAAPPWRWESPS